MAVNWDDVEEAGGRIKPGKYMAKAVGAIVARQIDVTDPKTKKKVKRTVFDFRLAALADRSGGKGGSIRKSVFPPRTEEDENDLRGWKAIMDSAIEEGTPGAAIAKAIKKTKRLPTKEECMKLLKDIVLPIEVFNREYTVKQGAEKGQKRTTVDCAILHPNQWALEEAAESDAEPAEPAEPEEEAEEPEDAEEASEEVDEEPEVEDEEEAEDEEEEAEDEEEEEEEEPVRPKKPAAAKPAAASKPAAGKKPRL